MMASGCLEAASRRRGDPRIRSMAFSSVVDSSECTSDRISAGTSWTSTRTRTGKPSMSARRSAIPSGSIGDSRVRRIGSRRWPGLVEEFTNCIGLDSAVLGSVPTNVVGLRSEVWRLV